MKIQPSSVRQVLLVLCIVVCACIALVGPSVAAARDAASVDASATIDASQADNAPHRGGRFPPPQSEPWFLSWYVWTVLPLGLLIVTLLVRQRVPATRLEATNRLVWSLVPACITFGPLFMTKIAGSASPAAGDELVFGGVVMLALGLGLMFGRIVDQQKQIEKLLGERRVAE